VKNKKAKMLIELFLMMKLEMLFGSRKIVF